MGLDFSVSFPSGREPPTLPHHLHRGAEPRGLDSPHMSHLLADSASPPHGPSLQLPPTSDTSVREPAHSDPLDAAASSSSSSSSCPPCSPDPGTEAPGPEPAEVAVGSGVNGEGRSEKGCLYCPTCKVTVNSASQLQAHNTGQCFPGPMASMAG